MNFSDNHTTYYSVYRYVTKEDNDALHSPSHPHLTDVPPQAESVLATKQRKAKAKQQRRNSTKRGGDRLSTLDVCQLVQAKSISPCLEVVSLVAAQVREEKTTLAEFIANRESKAVDETIQLAKEFAKAETHLNRSRKSRIELLQGELIGECVDGCGGRWLTAAKQLLQEIEKRSYCNAIYNALEKGRGKYCNVNIHGPASCRKSFISFNVSPLKVIYKAFSNPATGSFAFIGDEEAEIIHLNDFRWQPKIIPWPEFLQALKGDTVHLPAPKNLCSKILSCQKIPRFL